jgi:serine protease Do
MRVLSRQSIVVALLTGLLVSVLAPQLDAQDRRRRGRTQTYKHTRNSKKIRKVFAPCVAKVFAATVKVFSDDKAVAMGTVVGEAGLIVTKASELKDGEVTVAFRDEETQHKAVVVGTDEPNDLVLLRLEKKNLTKVEFAIDNATRTGSFVVTAATVETPLAYGIMSLARHARKPRTFLGVQSEPHAKGMRLTRVLPDTSADRAGLKPSDVIIAIDGKPTKDRSALSAAITSHKPGSTMKLRVLRDDKTIDVVAEMREDKDRHGRVSSQEQSRLWGPLSQVRVGFEEVIQHDTVIRPEHCGGPLCNLKGEVIGINISRVGRFETLAVTSKTVVASIARILTASTKVPAKEPAKKTRKE